MRPYIVLENGMSYGDQHLTKEVSLTTLLLAIDNENLNSIREILKENPEFIQISFLDNPGEGLQFGRLGNSYTVLGYAASRCKLEAIKLLIDEFHADPNQAAWMGPAPLSQLVRADRGGYNSTSAAYKTATLLVEKGADPNRKYPSDFAGSARERAEQTAPSIFNLALNLMNDNTQGANCRAVFARNDSLPLTFSYQVKRNAYPLMCAGAIALKIAANRMK